MVRFGMGLAAGVASTVILAASCSSNDRDTHPPVPSRVCSRRRPWRLGSRRVPVKCPSGAGGPDSGPWSSEARAVQGVSKISTPRLHGSGWQARPRRPH